MLRVTQNLRLPVSLNYCMPVALPDLVSRRTVPQRRPVWWDLSRRGSVCKHSPMHHLAPGLRLEQTPKTILDPVTGPRAHYCTLGPFPYSYPFSCLSYYLIVVMFYLLYDLFYCDSSTVRAPCSLYHATLPTIANATITDILP
jgi:hypothetical protein